MCILCLLSQIGGRGKEASILVVYNVFTSQLSIFYIVHTILQAQNHTLVSKGRHLALRSQTRPIHPVFEVFLWDFYILFYNMH